ncbi:MAG: hypothetical protein AAGN35_10335 [Bacteroidota bacterium]
MRLAVFFLWGLVASVNFACEPSLPKNSDPAISSADLPRYAKSEPPTDVTRSSFTHHWQS